VAFEKLYVGHCLVLNGKILYCSVAVRFNVSLALAKWDIARKRICGCVVTLVRTVYIRTGYAWRMRRKQVINALKPRRLATWCNKLWNR
jgi:hypothetical protein